MSTPAIVNSTTELHVSSSAKSITALCEVFLPQPSVEIVFFPLGYLISWSLAMVKNNDIFWMLVVQVKLDEFFVWIVRESIMSSKDVLSYLQEMQRWTLEASTSTT